MEIDHLVFLPHSVCRPRHLFHGTTTVTDDHLDRTVNRLFNVVFWLFLAVILYNLVRSLLLRFWPSMAPPPTSSFLPFPPDDGHHHGGGSGPGDGGGGGGGGLGFNPGPPPLYTKDETFPSEPERSAPSGGMGGEQGATRNFWTGALAGGAATYLANNLVNRGNKNTGNGLRDRSTFDRTRTMRDTYEDDRGVGSSTVLGEVRRATGFGGSNTR